MLDAVALEPCCISFAKTFSVVTRYSQMRRVDVWWHLVRPDAEWLYPEEISPNPPFRIAICVSCIQSILATRCPRQKVKFLLMYF